MIQAGQQPSESDQQERILVVEDSESKWNDIQATLADLLREHASLTRAATIVEAEALINKGPWRLLILDVSMDIKESATGPKRGGHDTLGGLRIANKMFLLGQEVPTIIVTAFDAFPIGVARQEGAEVLGLEDVRARAASILGSSFVGCVRYGDPGWESDLTLLARKAIAT